MDSQTNASKPLNILCLDGGGVRGVSSLLALKKIMEALQSNLNLDAPPLPCEVFDLICGTSTGGLIALMLGRLRMTVEQAINCYCTISEKVFGSTVRWPLWKQLQGKAMYDASILKECIREICLKYEGSEDARLRDPRDTGEDGICRVFVVAVNQVYADGAPKRFRSYRSVLEVADPCTIWEAARATTAASTFFDPMEVGNPPIKYIDGGLSGANNPSKLARDEVRRMFPRRPIGCFLSVGTGVGRVVSVSTSYAGIAKACAKLITDCQLVDHDIDAEFDKETREDGQESPYFRFSVEQGVGTVKLDEWKEIKDLMAVTDTYLRSDKQSSKIERCCNVLLDRAREVVERR